VLTILFDGIAYGMVLFILAVGLSVTLGLMNFINLAHGVFAMAGGYAGAMLVNRAGVPFLLALPLAFLAAALLGVLVERTLYVHVYRRSHLDQVLFTIGLVFMAVAAVDYFIGSSQQFIALPDFLRARLEILGGNIGAYRLFVVAVCAVIATLLQVGLSSSRFGARLRAAVDNGRVARGLGINVGRIFTATFAVGSGLAGLGGMLGAEFLGLDPSFPLKFLVYFLIVVTVGGTSSLTGPFLAAIILGIADVAGKYYLPGTGPFIIYAVMVVILIVRPYGLVARSEAR